MRSFTRYLLVSAAICAAAPAHAGETVLYGPAANWVEVTGQGDLALDGPADMVLLDMQQRIEGDTVTTYIDTAIRLSSPEALTQAGTSTTVWQPDKGDLTVHRVEVVRGDEVVDLLADGTRYTVLRRERELESRKLDGSLTATMPVPGLRIGDVLRIAYSQSYRDEALDGRVQTVLNLPSEPFRIATGRARVSWPSDNAVQWRVGPDVSGAQEGKDGRYRFVELDLPLKKRVDLPQSAPSRFTRPRVLQATTFADWAEVSRVFAPLFDPAGTIAEDGPIAAEVAKIEAASDDTLVRATMATRLVQDQVAYLMNGMSGGNYVPQSPAETWELRYGDCKAKTLLLLAMLDRMGIPAQAALVNSAVGDAVPDLLPSAGAFDHVIVKAEIAGTTYWLDGTQFGTRMATVADTPPFHNALPLDAAGTGLVAIEPRVPGVPLVSVTSVIDQRAGVDLPALVSLESRFAGPMASAIGAAMKQASEEQIKDLADNLARSVGNGMAVTEQELTYDEASGTALLSVDGLMTTNFKADGGRMKMDLGWLLSSEVSFNHDRARAAWRDIPVALGPAQAMAVDLTVLLPEGEDGYDMRGRPQLDLTYAGTRIVREASLGEGKLTVSERMAALGGELPPEDIAREKAAAQRIANSTPFLLAPVDTARSWAYGRKDLQSRVAPIEKAYAAKIAREPEEASGYLERARFRWQTMNLAGALKDYDAAIDRDPDQYNHYMRAALLTDLARPKDALADYRKAFEISPTAERAADLAAHLGRMGETEEALALVEQYDDYADNHEMFVQTRADILALGERREEGLTALDELIADSPGKPYLLNASCWYRARFGVGIDGMIDICNRAVEQASSPVQALDSRALAWLQLGEMDKAIADADAALAMSPESDATRYIRGFALRAQGHAEGAEDIRYFARNRPGMAEEYATYGLKP